jgi:putative ABC transport system permease protein
MLLQDVRFALRTFARKRAFATIAIATLALGIGAATSIYSVVDGILFRPLPYRDAGRLIAVWQTYPQWLKEPILRRSWDRIPLSIPEFWDWRATQTSFSSVAIWSGGAMMLGDGDSREQVRQTLASASLLDVLGVRPALGRFFLPGEDVVGGAPVTVLSYENWQSRYAGDPGVLGRAVHFDEGTYTVIGVLPKGLSLTHGDPAAPFWIPVGQDSANARQRGNHSFPALGRLKPGVTLAAATAETERILRGDRKPEDLGVRLQDWQSDLTRDVRKPLLILFTAVGLLLLVSCVNVATLLLGEATAREQEMAARMAMGAGRTRILTQLLTESVVLAGVAAVVGATLAWGGTHLLVALAPPRIPGLLDVRVDLRVLAFALAASVATGIVFGLAPALTLARSGPAMILRGVSGQSVRGRGSLQRTLVAVELALSVILLVGAGLLSRSLAKLTSVDPGFRTANLLALRVSLPRAKARDTLFTGQFFRAALERLGAVPGVVAVTASTTHPFGGGSSSSSFLKEGETEDPNARKHEAQQRTTLPNFFQTMGIPVLAGRTYTDADQSGAPLVVVVNETMARRDWPNESALGRRVRFQGEWREIIGVVGDIKFGKLSGDYEATIFAPHAQRPTAGLTLLVRTRDERLTPLEAFRTAIHDIEPSAVVLGADRMSDLVKRSFADERYRTVLISLFGLIAAVLAAGGMYGVTSRAVSRRMREMGIRIALGANARSVTGLVVRHTLAGVVIGAAIGVAAALAAAQYLAPFLYGIKATDGSTYIAILVFLVVVSILASWLPARRAASVQPASVLRSE